MNNIRNTKKRISAKWLSQQLMNTDIRDLKEDGYTAELLNEIENTKEEEKSAFVLLEVTGEDLRIDDSVESSLLSFTTSTDDLICDFDTPTFGVTYRVYKEDDSIGTVTIRDHDTNVIAILRYQYEHIDIQYKNETTYLIM
jgi:hypothetical protein